VPGNFHISSHEFGEAYQSLYFDGKQISMKHKINKLSFGDKTSIYEIYQRFGQKMNDELDGVSILAEPFRGGQLYV
jgi:hypothetical protein